MKDINKTSYNFSDTEWKAIREGGQHKFSVRYGVMRWGIVMFLVMTVFNYTVNYNGSALYDLLKFLLLNISIWVTAGYLYGLIVFHLLNKKYNKNN